jgi:hypothetical protein
LVCGIGKSSGLPVLRDSNTWSFALLQFPLSQKSEELPPG